MTPDVLLAASKGLGQDLLLQAGGAAAVVSLIAMALVVPLYVTQRREVKRLERWRELEPERGDEGASLVAATATAPAPSTGGYPAQSTAAAGTPAARPATGGFMTPAERVTADRPALERITAERAAIQSPSFWRRLIARGPRHPLVLSAVAIVLAGALVAAVYLGSGKFGDNGKEKGGGLDRSEVSLVILNAAGTAGLADRVADDVAAEGFTDVRTGVTGSTNQTVVLFADGQKRAANVIAKYLGIDILQPIQRDVRAIAPDADVVVIAGEDRARA